MTLSSFVDTPSIVSSRRELELYAGQIIADKYRIEHVIGGGGMGVVVAATHLELGLRVAIKFLRDSGQSESIARFQREARSIVQLRSEHVARVYDVGSLDDGTPFIVMEHLEGEDLSTKLKQRGELSVVEAVDYVLQACEAVAEAHQLGIVHRDLKPANLFLAAGPSGAVKVKVLDFGVSKAPALEGIEDTSLTLDGVALGSPGYMSPEQMTSSRDVDARSDIWSLGAILYRAVSGRPPYEGESVTMVVARMATTPLMPLGALSKKALPAGFEALVARSLAQDKAARFQSVAELARALVPYASPRGRMSVEAILATHDMTTPDLGTQVHESGPVLPPVEASTAILPAVVPPPPAPGDTGRSEPTVRLRAPRSSGAALAMAALLFIAAAAAIGAYVVSRVSQGRTAAVAPSAPPAASASARELVASARAPVAPSAPPMQAPESAPDSRLAPPSDASSSSAPSLAPTARTAPRGGAASKHGAPRPASSHKAAPAEPRHGASPPSGAVPDTRH